MDKKLNVVLKVSGKTPPGNLKAAIVGYIKDEKVIYLDSIGVLANYAWCTLLKSVHGLTFIVIVSIQ